MSAESLLRAEADLYRKTLIRLYCDAASGPSKTLDKDEVARITGLAIEDGNELSRRAKEDAGAMERRD